MYTLLGRAGGRGQENGEQSCPYRSIHRRPPDPRGLLDSLPDDVGGRPGGGRHGDGIGQLVAGNLHGAFLRRSVEVWEGAHLDVERDRLAPVVDAVRAVVGDTAL